MPTAEGAGAALVVGLPQRLGGDAAEALALFVDRFLDAAMHHPCNYGHLEGTRDARGEPLEGVLVTGLPLPEGTRVPCRVVGMLSLELAGGAIEHRMIAVPQDAVSAMYHDIAGPDDLPRVLRDQIGHLFQHCAELEHGAWVRVAGWGDAAAAARVLAASTAEHR